VAIRHGVPLVVVPSGTRNHFALDLGLDRDDVVGALAGFDAAFESRVDVARVNDRLFVNNASVGVYAKLVQSDSYRADKRRTIAAMVPDLLGPGSAPLDLRFDAADGSHQTTAHVVLVSNDPYRLHRLAVGRFRRARLDSGELGIAAVGFSSARDVARFVGLEVTGRGRRFPGWYEWAAPTFRIDSGAPVEVGIDGEAVTLDPPLLFQSQPRALRVRLPPGATSARSAGRRVHVFSSRSIGRLAALVSGRG
jgi:diacylglycerol kinase family enzyme